MAIGGHGDIGTMMNTQITRAETVVRDWVRTGVGGVDVPWAVCLACRMSTSSLMPLGRDATDVERVDEIIGWVALHVQQRHGGPTAGRLFEIIRDGIRDRILPLMPEASRERYMLAEQTPAPGASPSGAFEALMHRMGA